MQTEIKVFVNGNDAMWSPSGGDHIIVKNRDLIEIKVFCGDDDCQPQVFFDKALMELKNEAGNTYTSVCTDLFKETFGYSRVDVDCDGDVYSIVFDVLCLKVNASKVEDIIKYLNSKSESLTNVCVLKADGRGRDNLSPELIVGCAESVISYIVNNKNNFTSQLKTRLTPKRVAAWNASRTNANIDPFDVINNIDGLRPTHEQGDLTYRGRNFEFSGVDISVPAECADVEENRIILGGLYSIRRAMAFILNSIDEQFVGFPSLKLDGSYESLSSVMMRVLTVKMKARIISIQNHLGGLIKLFHSLGVTCQGELQPVITPFVRGNHLYRCLFQHLHAWFDLDSSMFGNFDFLFKIRSLSKLYEIYCLYQIVDVLNDLGWVVLSVNVGERNNVDLIELSNGKHKLKLFYEKAILPLTSTTKNNELVDVHHYGNKEYYRWQPDFVLQHESGDEVKYLILDAKYSGRDTTQKLHSPEIFNKYYVGTSVYNEARNCLTNDAIAGVIALYSGGPHDGKGEFTRSQQHGWLSDVVRWPLSGGVAVYPGEHQHLKTLLARVFDLFS